MNALYKISNVIIATVFASTMAYACYSYAPEFWQSLDNTFGAGCLLVIGLVGTLTVGFLTMETRKA